MKGTLAMLKAGDILSFFRVTARDGRAVAYAEIWQKKNLVLVQLPYAGAEPYVSQLDARMADLTAYETACVITRDQVPGLPSPGVAVADRWGELFFVAAGLEPVDELIEWLRYTQMQCPECRGEER